VGGGGPVLAQVGGLARWVDVAVPPLAAPAADVAPLAFGDSDAVRVGDPVVAIGSPFGLGGSVTTGIVSGLRRQIDAPNGFAITGVLQTDAALNPGNSGGPLLDISGRVIGVSTQIATDDGRNEGIGFAVPAAVVKRTAARIVATGRAELPYLGIVGSDADGVLLHQVIAGGPADGLLAAGDTIVAVDGDPVADNAGLAALLATRAPGERVRVSVRRGEGETVVTVPLGLRPEDGP
jgi:putative serine protease PepD